MALPKITTAKAKARMKKRNEIKRKNRRDRKEKDDNKKNRKDNADETVNDMKNSILKMIVIMKK